MTTEHRIVFRPSDIRRIIFECGDCGGSTAVAGGHDLRHGDEVGGCPSCGKQWMANYSGATAYRDLLGALQRVIDAQRTETAFTLRFELDATPSGSRK